MARLTRGPHGSDDSDDDFASLFGDVGDVDDEADAHQPAFPPVAPPERPRAPQLPDPRSAPPSYDIPELSMPLPPRPKPEPRAPSNAVTGDEGSFFWGLAPNDQPDPLVHGGSADDADPDAAQHDDPRGARGLVPPTVPLAPYIPPVFDAPVPEQRSEPTPPSPTIDVPTWQAAQTPSPFGASAADEPAQRERAEQAERVGHAEEQRQEQGPEQAQGPDQAQSPEQAQSNEQSWGVAASEAAAASEVPAPGTVKLPWLRRSRRAERDGDDGAAPWDQPGETPEPTQDASTTAFPWDLPAATDAEPEQPSAAFPWELPAEPREEQRREEQRPTPAFPWETAPEQTPKSASATSESWSLFGDLTIDEPEVQGESAGRVEQLEPVDPSEPDRQPEPPSWAPWRTPEPDPQASAPDDYTSTATDLFAALTATSATEAIPGASASEAAAYDIPGDTDEPAWPWTSTAGPADAGTALGAPGTDGASAGAGVAGAAFGAAAGAAASSAASNEGSRATRGTASAASSDSPYRRGQDTPGPRRGGVEGGSNESRSRDTGTGGRGSGGPGSGGAGSGGAGSGGGDHDDDDGGPSPRAQRIMLIVAGAMLLVLLLVALFIVGRTVTHPAAAPSASPTPTKTATPTPTPTPTPAAAGPQAPGKHPWNSLRGGECLQPFTTPWADTFTVVDCATPHAGQMVYTGLFSTDPKAAFPGADQLASQINLLCSRPGVLNLDAAGQIDDAQVQGSYPVTAKQWQEGQRSYYCFVNRTSGQPITGSLAGPGPQ